MGIYHYHHIIDTRINSTSCLINCWHIAGNFRTLLAIFIFAIYKADGNRFSSSHQCQHGFLLLCQNSSSFVSDCFFPTTKHPLKVTRLAMIWPCSSIKTYGFSATTATVIWFSFSISGQFWPSEDMPIFWSCGTRFWVANFRLLYFKN